MQDNKTLLYALGAIYIALTETIGAATGKEVEPLADHILKRLVPLMPTEAADVCTNIATFAASQDGVDFKRELNRALN